VKALNEPIAREAVLSCMIYVDSNPVRANMATPEEPEHTSIKEGTSPQFFLRTAIKKQTGILFSTVDYLELVEYTGCIAKEGKRSVIQQITPPTLKRLNLNTEEWLTRSR